MEHDRLLARANEVLQRLELVPAVFVERRSTGLIEVCGLGSRIYGTDDQLDDALMAVLDLNDTLDYDDLRDRVAWVLLTAFDA